MSKSTQRRYEALDYEVQKSRLTTKQYLVYSYLLSISKWNAEDNEQHYYVYKNSFKVKDACEFLKISQPTWRKAIDKLQECHYLLAEGKRYKIRIPQPYVQIEISLIKTLLSFGISIGCGNIISIFSLLYSYWESCKKMNEECTITIGQLKKIFTTKKGTESTILYKTALAILESLGLLEISTRTQSYNGITYNVYLIKKMRLNSSYSIELDQNSPNNIEKILDKIKIIDNIEIVE